MPNIHVPPMIPLRELREMKKKEPFGMEKTMHSIRVATSHISSSMTKEKEEFQIECLSGTYAGAVFPLDSEIIFGRNPGEANIVFPKETPGISRKHCSIKVGREGAVHIKDLGSSQGTFFENGTQLQPNTTYRMKRGECFYLASKNETFKVI